MSLTDVEKLAIDNLVSQGKSLKEIKEVLGKSPKSRLVDNYVKEIPAKNSPGHTYDHQAVLNKLSAAGIHGDKALELINRALSKIDDNKRLEVSQVYNAAIREVGPRELMVGDKTNGVKIMTGEASARGDNYEKRTESRSYRDAVYKPNEK